MEKNTESPNTTTFQVNPTSEKKRNRNKTSRSRKYTPSVKEYKIVVTFSQISEEEARRKRSIIEGIIKRTYLK